MAGVLRDHGGGIRGLLRFLREHGEAIEYELLTLGLHIDYLGTRKLTWRDLKVVVLGSPPGGALHRSIDPKGALWQPDTYLLAGVVDFLAVQIWQQSKKGTRKPEPVWRPNVKPKKQGRSLTAAALKNRGNHGN